LAVHRLVSRAYDSLKFCKAAAYMDRILRGAMGRIARPGSSWSSI
jgi:hypothetical protein